MEYWVKRVRGNPILHHSDVRVRERGERERERGREDSNTPILQHSNTPSLQHSITPPHRPVPNPRAPTSGNSLTQVSFLSRMFDKPADGLISRDSRGAVAEGQATNSRGTVPDKRKLNCMFEVNEPLISFWERRPNRRCENAPDLGVALQFVGTEGPARGPEPVAGVGFEKCAGNTLRIKWSRDVSWSKSLRVSNSRQ